MTDRRARFVSLSLLFLLTAAAGTDEVKPYEFSFNIEDFQHRYEKKDSSGIVTGEYGFITADGVYHETGYATDENGNFIITKMKNRKITSLQVAQEIFKGKPEVAKRVIEVLAKSCSGCGIPVEKPPGFGRSNSTAGTLGMRRGNELASSSASGRTTLLRDGQRERDLEAASKTSANKAARDVLDPKIPRLDNEIGKHPSDFHYHFNYTITSHGHEETGYQDGKKNGSYRTLGPNGTDARVEYISNEFGHQPNISFVNRPDALDAEETLAGFAFKWIFEKR
ncbi:protein lethal(3)malignant blood neoplasm 1 [Venturia canescens]|uniref:protein lethal(3)malignant blood neoplasm 1 n=1 Tax=Venturia canescens TaxID=32260 RepID=UPI001C9CC36D|nr:protein lethal(3)malignant blood neoplasm 1 [Venturia canescens]